MATEFAVENELAEIAAEDTTTEVAVPEAPAKKARAKRTAPAKKAPAKKAAPKVEVEVPAEVEEPVKKTVVRAKFVGKKIRWTIAEVYANGKAQFGRGIEGNEYAITREDDGVTYVATLIVGDVKTELGRGDFGDAYWFNVNHNKDANLAAVERVRVEAEKAAAAEARKAAAAAKRAAKKADQQVA